MQILGQFSGNLSERVSGKQSSLNLSIFLFFFCFNEKFQSSLNFELSLWFFSSEFLVEFSFSWIFLVELQLSTFVYFYFYFLGSSIHEAHDIPICWLKFSCLQLGPKFLLMIRLVALDKKEGVTFWCRTVWDYFSLLHSSQIKCHTWSAWFFS